MKYIVAAFLLVFGCVFGGIGAVQGWEQQHIITTYVPMNAELIETHVVTHVGSKGSRTYSPEATYRYSIDGKAYTSHQIFPLNISESGNWAHEVVARLQAAAKPTPLGTPAHFPAFVDPNDPSQSILLREYSSFPYFFFILGVAIFVPGVGILTGALAGGRNKMTAIALDNSGWRLLIPQENLRREFLDSTLWFAGALVATGIPFFHWIFVAHQGGLSAIVMALLLLLALSLTGAYMYLCWSVTRHMSDARLRVNPIPMKRGDPFAVELEADAFVPLHVTEIQGHLICIEHYKETRGSKTQYGTRNCADHAVAMASAMQIEKGGTVQGNGTLLCQPESAPASTDISRKKVYPYYTWELRIHIALEGAADYRAAFPVEAV